MSLAQAFSTIHEWDAALFARMSTVLQQVDPASFGLGSIAAIAQAYSHQEVCPDPRLLVLVLTCIVCNNRDADGLDLTRDALCDASRFETRPCLASSPLCCNRWIAPLSLPMTLSRRCL